MTIPILTPSDVRLARSEARSVARKCELDMERVEMVVLAVSELATNLLRYAQRGHLDVSCIETDGRSSVQIESHDQGPGIVDLTLALQDNYSTGGGLGSGLPAVRRMMDEFSITSSSEGTTVIVRKWKRLPSPSR